MKKTIKILFSTFLLISVMLLVFTSCKKEVPFNGINEELGISIEGGGFNGDATLISSRVSETINVNEVKEKLGDKPYSDTSELFIYFINVVNHGSTVQPSGKIKVTLPEPQSDFNEYIVFHVFGTESHTLDFTVDNGKVFVEVDALGYFIIADSHVHDYTEWSDARDGENHTRSCPCGYVALVPHDYNKGTTIPNGIRYTCQTCNFTYDHIHEYGDWSDSKDGKNHYHTCSCGYKASAEHTFDTGVDVPTGTLYTCTGCGYTKTVSNTVNISVSTAPYKEAGTITVTVNGEAVCTNAKEYSGTVIKGSVISVTFTSKSGYKFVQWKVKDKFLNEDELISTQKAYTFTVGVNDFTLGKETISIIAENAEDKSDEEISTPIM